MRSTISILVILLAGAINLSAQLPVVRTPQPASISPAIIGNTHKGVNPAPGFPSNPNPWGSMNTYEQDRLEVERRRALNQQILFESDALSNRIRNDLPLQAGIAQGTEQYLKAMQELIDMINGTVPMNVGEAVFIVENAYLEGKLDKSKYNRAIEQLTTIAWQKALEDRYDWNDPATKNVMLFRVMADTLKVKSSTPEKGMITSFPMRYDFEDFAGKEDYSQMFVSKLLATKKGQCHSLPLLYLILCEKAGTEANIAYSPSHSYVTFRDRKGNRHNLELTNGRVVTDAFIAGSGYVSSESIRSGAYMQPQTKKQTIVQCLSDLAMGYIHKYDYDPFVGQCVDSVLQYDPGNLSGLILKANYLTVRFEYVVDQIGRPHPDILKEHYPQVYQLLEDRNVAYRAVDDTGFREMPREAYQHWLNSVKEEKEKQEAEENLFKVMEFSK